MDFPDSLSSVATYRRAIARVFRDWESLPRLLDGFRIDGILDLVRERYVLQDVDLHGGRFQARTLAYLEIRDGKIWILTDNTEQGIAPDLVAAGIPKDRIVLAFYPPAIRETSEFAVA